MGGATMHFKTSFDFESHSMMKVMAQTALFAMWCQHAPEWFIQQLHRTLNEIMNNSSEQSFLKKKLYLSLQLAKIGELGWFGQVIKKTDNF